MDSLPVNQLYGSDSLETAEREIQHFFPLQSTLGLIKPHATSEQRGKYLRIKVNVYIFSKFCEHLKNLQAEKQNRKQKIPKEKSCDEYSYPSFRFNN